MEIIEEIALALTVKEIEANLYFCNFWQKFKMAVIFEGRKIFGKGSLLRYPVGRKFR